MGSRARGRRLELPRQERFAFKGVLWIADLAMRIQADERLLAPDSEGIWRVV